MYEYFHESAPQKLDDGVISSEQELHAVLSWLAEYWDLNLEFLKEQETFFIDETSLHPLI